MKIWLSALRRPSIPLGGLTTAAVFLLAGHAHEAFFPALSVMLGSTFAVLYNDWCDRRFDLRKGKTLATLHPTPFKYLTVVSLLLVVASITTTWQHLGWRIGIVLTVMGVVICAYSHLKRLPFIPALTVALTFATITLLPAAAGYPLPATALTFWGALVTVFAREVMLDLSDVEVDRDSKWTLPLAIGERRASSVAGILLLASSIFATLHQTLAISLPFTAIAALLLVSGHRSSRLAKNIFDLGIVLALAVTLITEL